MPLVESESLVLKSYNLAEADRIVVFFTREQGLIRGVAKGAKRLKSKFGSTLEPFSTVNLQYFQKEDRELVSIQHVELVRSSFDIASDPGYLRTYSHLVDLLQTFAPPNDPNETLYRMVKACFETKLSSAADLNSIRIYFELWLMRLGGYLPDWKSCQRCKRQFDEFETVTADHQAHLFCGNCRPMRDDQTISPVDRQVFHNVQKMPPADFADDASDKAESVAAIERQLRRMINISLGHDGSVGRSLSVKF